MTQAEFVKSLTYAALAFDRELTKEVVAVYFDQLGHYEAHVFTQAIRRCVARGDRFPTVHDIRDEIRESKDRHESQELKQRRLISDQLTEARKQGKITSADEACELVTDLEKRFSVKRVR